MWPGVAVGFGSKQTQSVPVQIGTKEKLLMSSAQNVQLWSSVVCVYALACAPGGASAATVNVPADQPTIQAGINAASNGDEVVIADGTYIGPGNVNLDFAGKVITVRSASNTPAACIIDCQAVNGTRGFHFHSAEPASAVVQGLTIKNGKQTGGMGGGIHIVLSNPTIINCAFSGNTANLGAAINNSAGSPTIDSCVFTGNVASGASSLGGGIYSTSATNLTVVNCTFTSNTSLGGGGMYFTGTTLTIGTCAFPGGSNSPDGLRLAGGTVASIGASAGGACCINGTCVVTTSPNCVAAGGTYQGNGSTCASANCPPNSCTADIEPNGGDGMVNTADLLKIINSWGLCP
jgi:predicted outer membrane repeat protein